MLHVANAIGTLTLIPHSHHFTSHWLNSNCHHCISLPYDFLCFSRAHFACQYENERSLGESKPMTDDNWNIKYFSSHTCQLTFYPGCQIPQSNQAPFTQSSGLLDYKLFSGGLPCPVSLSHSMIKFTGIPSHIKDSGANPCVGVCFLYGPI